MTVAELIEKLSTHDPAATVWVGLDEGYEQAVAVHAHDDGVFIGSHNHWPETTP